MQEKNQIVAIRNYVLKGFPELAQRIFKDETTLDMEFIENCGHLSRGQKMLVMISLSIWNGDAKIDLYELLTTLDKENLQNVIEALRHLVR